jgi:uncharacterized protein DUF1629
MHYLLFSAGHLYPVVELTTPIEEDTWTKGRPLDDSIPELTFELDGGRSFAWPDFIRPGPNIPLISPPMREGLGKAGVDNIEYYPARVINRSTKEERKYFAANVIGLVSAMDRGKSDFMPYDSDPNIILDISKLVLDERRCAGVQLFRLAEFEILMVVDEGVKIELERRNLFGLQFVRPEDWDGFST